MADHGAVAAVWPAGKNCWKAAFWGGADGRLRELEDKFATKKAAMTAVLAIEQGGPVSTAALGQH